MSTGFERFPTRFSSDKLFALYATFVDVDHEEEYSAKHAAVEYTDELAE